MVNNFDKIRSRLDRVFNLNNPDLFFHVELLQRKKEVPEINKNSNVIKSYAVKNLEYLERKLETEIIPICQAVNARAMINLNPKSFKRVTHGMLRRLSEYIEDGFYEGSITKVFDSCTASSSINKSLGIEKYWIIDIDTKDHGTLNQVRGSINPDNVRELLESKSGYHLLVTPFNVMGFSKINDVEIKKDCLTNLFIP